MGADMIERFALTVAHARFPERARLCFRIAIRRNL
jgi:hypothetical protein